MSKITGRIIDPKDVLLFPTTPSNVTNGDQNKLIEYLEITFLLDATASMGAYIEMAKNKIKSMIASIEMVLKLKLMKDRNKIDFDVITKVSLIAYRDFGDTKQFEYLPSTTNMDDVYNALKNIKAIGGMDTPEDVLGAFILFFDKLEILVDQTHTTKIIILIADAPGHGKFMNAGHQDNHINVDDESEWKKYLNKLKDNKIEFICVQLTDMMDQMTSFFRNNYDDENHKLGLVKITSGDTEKVAEEITTCTSKYCVQSIDKRTSNKLN